MKSGVTKTVDNLDKVQKALEHLTSQQIFVGVPEEKAQRQGEAINNATLAYIHNYGAPEAGIPARPFMEPTIRAEKSRIVEGMKIAGTFALAGRKDAVERQLHRIGLSIVAAIQARIQAGIPPPLKPATIARRRIRSKASKYRRKATTAAQVVPLIDTGAMIRSITYVIRTIATRLRRR